MAAASSTTPLLANGKLKVEAAPGADAGCPLFVLRAALLAGLASIIMGYSVGVISGVRLLLREPCVTLAYNIYNQGTKMHLLAAWHLLPQSLHVSSIRQSACP